jgi:hypothetical protein
LQRAETGIGQVMKKPPGFRGYYVFDAGNGVAGSVTLFDTRRAAAEANEKALAWIRESLIDFIEGGAGGHLRRGARSGVPLRASGKVNSDLHMALAKVAEATDEVRVAGSNREHF